VLATTVLVGLQCAATFDAALTERRKPAELSRQGVTQQLHSAQSAVAQWGRH
jgi:hypothetical protein